MDSGIAEPCRHYRIIAIGHTFTSVAALEFQRTAFGTTTTA
jgi:hypothetical protein